MKLTEPYKNIPENILKMILEQLIKEGLTYDDMEIVYEDTDIIDNIESVLKKFGFTDIDYEDFGFFAELFMLNEGKTDGQLIIPKPKEYVLHFKVVGRKWFTEWWNLNYTAYNRNFVNDMFNNGDLSYYDGVLVDEDIDNSETDDWEMREIVEVKPEKSKNKISEGKEKLNNELRELQKLKMIVEERIRLLTP